MISNPQNTCMSCFTQHAAPANPCPVCGYNETAQEFPPHILRPRTILHGKYLLGKVLGQGGFGITYIGWDLNLGIKVAIKEYYPSGFVSRETTSVGNATVQPFTGSQGDYFKKGREKFINEARILAKFFALPGIVSIKDFFQENGTAYISMEYIDGQTLKDYLAQMGGRLPANQIFDMMKPVMYSLAEVHNAGLIHRDISPDNIMISKDGQMKLLDFGAARDFSDSGNKSMSIMLKPGFAPEEQYRSRGVQGPWTDVYALSATIYRCITGITPEESVERTRRDEVRPPSMLGISIDPAQEAALMKGMAVLQEHRFQNVSELYSSFYGAQTGASTAAHVSATAQPAAVPASHTPQQYQNPTQQPQQYQHTMHPAQQQQSQHTTHPAQQQPQHGYQQPQPFAQTPPKKPGWLKRHKVPVGIGGAVLGLIILLGIIFSSDSPSGTPPLPPGGDVTVTASPPVDPPPTTDPEPPVGQVSLDGTWVMRMYEYPIMEFGFSDIGNRFYLLLFHSPVDDPDSFMVLEGTFAISGDTLVLTTTWSVEHEAGVYTDGEIEQDISVLDFSLDGQTLTVYFDDDTPSELIRGQSLGVWSFNHRETIVFTGEVEDMPYVLNNANATIPGIYTGLWANNAPNGFGEFTYTESGDAHTGSGFFIEGTVLTGTFVNGLLEGSGELTTLEGHHYEGNFVNGMRTGYGKYTWPDGDVAEGEFKDGQQHGYGRYSWAVGDYFEGYFENGEYNGPGKYVFADGRVFEGEWVNDKRNGPGTLWAADGTIIRQGIWVDGEFQE